MNAEKQKLEQQRWNIAYSLSGKMGSDCLETKPN